jgi:hypothetical protein
VARIRCFAERNRGASIESLVRSCDDDRIEKPKFPLKPEIFHHHRTVWKMAFIPMRLKPESGANRIKSADDAYSFMMYMRLSYRNKPHWQLARQALNHATASDASEIQAWRTFRAAAEAEGWLAE